MKLRIRLPNKDDPIHMFVDAAEDGGVGREFVFNEGRIVPVYCYYPGERRGYVLRSGEGRAGIIPNIEGQYRILLTVRGPEVERLEKGIQRLYEEADILEGLPDVFWPRLGTLTAWRGFRVCMVTELYLATRQVCLLREELERGSPG